MNGALLKALVALLPVSALLAVRQFCSSEETLSALSYSYWAEPAYW
jgi:hypothetical protein